MEFCFGVKTQRYGARREARRIRVGEKAFHAAEVEQGGELSLISASVSLSNDGHQVRHTWDNSRPFEPAAFF